MNDNSFVTHYLNNCIELMELRNKYKIIRSVDTMLSDRDNNIINLIKFLDIIYTKYPKISSWK